jgi:hypothetical protein
MGPKQKVLAVSVALAAASAASIGLPATAFAAANGVKLLSEVQSAVASQRGFQWSYKGVEIGATEYETTYVGKDAGSQSVTIVKSTGKGSVSVIVVGAVAYLKANTLGLEEAGFEPSAAQAEAGKWISVTEATGSFYQSVAGGLTSASVSAELTMSAPVTERRSRVLRQNVIELKGTAAPAAQVDTGTVDSLYVAASGSPLPVELVQYVSGIGSTYIYSHWGQVPRVSAPRGAIAYEASWT